MNTNHVHLDPIKWSTTIIAKNRLGFPAANTLAYLTFQHRDHSMHVERVNMHCQGIACTRSAYIGLTSVEGQKLECF
jgi:hypothetical protein